MMSARTLAITTVLLLAGSAVLASPASAVSHYYGEGHANVTWTYSTFPPYVHGTGSGYLTNNLATFGQAIAWGMPMPVFDVQVLPATAPTPVQGRIVMHVPPATDPWWGGYPGPVPLGITTGGTIEFTLTGNAEHHPNAVNLFGTFTVTAATGQYTGLVSNGQWSGTTTGGGSSFGPYWDFSVIGQYV